LAVKTSLLPSVAVLATTIHWPSGENPTLWLMTVSVKCVIWVRAVPSGWTVKKLPIPDSSSATGVATASGPYSDCARLSAVSACATLPLIDIEFATYGVQGRRGHGPGTVAV
jgi:hypothetical protein